MASNADTLATLVVDIASGRVKVVDLTQPLYPDTPVIQLPPEFAASPPFSMQELSRYDDRGPAWYWSTIACGEHTGTHFDAPIHWATGKDYPSNTTETISVERFIGPACVVDAVESVKQDSDFLLFLPWNGPGPRVPSPPRSVSACECHNPGWDLSP